MYSNLNTRTYHQSENPYIGILKEGRAYIALRNGWGGGNVCSKLVLDEKLLTGVYREDFMPLYLELV